MSSVENGSSASDDGQTDQHCELRLLYRGLMYARKIRKSEIGCFEPP